MILNPMMLDSASFQAQIYLGLNAQVELKEVVYAILSSP